MLASVLHEFNRPWRLQDVPDPAPGPGQVLVRVTASGVCGTDLHVHHGYLDVSAPLIAGHEPVGIVEAVGESVTTVRVGDRVGVSWTQRTCGRCGHCLAGRGVHCDEAQTWMDLGGGHAELMLAWAEGCTPIPDGLADELAAPLFCAGHTVMSGMHSADLRPGDRVAVLGLGGLGHLAIQYAAALGHEVLALTSTDEKADDARALGAHEAVTTGFHPGLALEDAGGADVVLCTSNSAMQVSQVVSGLRRQGRLVNMGFLDGPVVLDMMDVTFTQARIIGAVQDRREHLVEALELAAAGRVTPVVETYRLDEVNDVLARLDAGTVRYRAVLTSDG